MKSDPSNGAALPPPAWPNLRRHFRVLCREFGKDTSGLAMLAGTRRSIEAECYAGAAHLEHRIPVEAATRFNLASLSKPITATGVLLLVEEGVLNLDDSIARYYPRWKAQYSPITLRHLLRHSSGLRLAEPINRWPRRYQTVIVNGDWIDALDRTRPKPVFEPGTRFEYSNLGYILLAEIVARASGMCFEEYLRTRVFRPFGMRRAHLLTERKPVIPSRATGYSRWPDGAWAFQDIRTMTTGDGGVFGTARDVYAFWRSLLQTRRIGRLLKQAMFAPGIPTPPPSTAYGYGWMYYAHRGLVSHGHTGTDSGCAHTFRFVGRPGDERFALLLSNSGWRFTKEARHQLMRTWLPALAGRPCPIDA